MHILFSFKGFNFSFMIFVEKKWYIKPIFLFCIQSDEHKVRYLFSGLKHKIFAEVFLSRMMQGMFTERGTIEANTLDDSCIHSTWFENNTISQTKINNTGAKKR